jgi:hypothetical protein
MADTSPRTRASTASSAGASSTSAIRLADLLGLDLGEAAGGHGRRAEADAGGDEGLLRIIGDAFLFTVMWALPSAFGVLAGDVLGRRSTRNTCDSVRPETMRRPRLVSTLAIT